MPKADEALYMTAEQLQTKKTERDHRLYTALTATLVNKPGRCLIHPQITTINNTPIANYLMILLHGEKMKYAIFRKECSTENCCNLDHYEVVQHEQADAAYINRLIKPQPRRNTTRWRTDNTLKKSVDQRIRDNSSAPDPITGCITYMPHKPDTGRALYINVEGRIEPLLRVVWQINTGKFVLNQFRHKCQNRRCINPNHIYPLGVEIIVPENSDDGPAEIQD